MSTERESIDAIQKHLAAIKDLEKLEVKRAQDAGDATLTNAWSKAFHKTGLHHSDLTDLLLVNYPDFSEEVVTRGGGGGR